MFKKIFISTVGVLVVFNCLGIILLTINRRYEIFSNNRTLNGIFIIGFIFNYLLIGICLFLIGLYSNK